jgi:uncharacterized protein (TIGR03083 family)
MKEEQMPEDARTLIAALRKSHDRLMATVDALSDEQLTGPSYCRDWTVAQVLSHLGSGAEMSVGTLGSALTGALGLEPAERQALWARWDAKSPEQMRDDFRAADTTSLERLESLDDKELASIHVSRFGMELDAAGLVRLRLGEHVIHSWDVEVMVDPSAALLPDAVPLLVDHVGRIARRTAKPPAEPVQLTVHTDDPKRRFRLATVEAVQLEPVDGNGAGGELRLPAEALIRLVYGRLDPDHTPEVRLIGTPVTLAGLRQMFPGF